MIQKLEIGHRKIQRIQKAHYVNLPKIWINHNHAKQGDSVQVRLEPDGSLNVSITSAAPCQERAEAASDRPKKECAPACQ